MGITPTTNHGLSKQAKKDKNWHVALNSTMDEIDARLPRGHDGDPNGEVIGKYLGQPLYDYTNKLLYFCTLVGAVDVAEWEISGGDGSLAKEVKMWYGTIAEIPAGYQLCDGTNGLPDLRNKFIVGANADDAGVAKSTITGVALQSGGATSANTNSTGGFTPAGSISATTLTSSQIPAHDHSAGTLVTSSSGGNGVFYFRSSQSSGSGTDIFIGTGGSFASDNGGGAGTITVYGTAHTHTITGNTGSAGTGGSHTHTFTGTAQADHNHSVTIVPPFYALAFIARTPT